LGSKLKKNTEGNKRGGPQSHPKSLKEAGAVPKGSEGARMMGVLLGGGGLLEGYQGVCLSGNNQTFFLAIVNAGEATKLLGKETSECRCPSGENDLLMIGRGASGQDL